MPSKIKPVIDSQKNDVLKCIIYKSVLKQEYNTLEIIDTIYKKSYYTNNRLKITGELILDHTDRSVIQILEGDAEVVTNLFEKISKDSRHYNIVVLTNNIISKRKYNKWVIKKTILQKNKTDILDYKMIGIIGNGASGNVTLVQNIFDGNYFALKSISKNKSKIQNILNERKILLAVKNQNFFIKLESCFQDPLNIYFLLAYAPKGDMYSFLKHFKKFPSDLIQFYMVQLIEALSFLHSRKIVHRDLKLENILIGDDGYLMVTDFGVSTYTYNENNNQLKGTPVYFSPELVNDENIGCFNDIWALGILFYEFVEGNNPYNCMPSSIAHLSKLIEHTDYNLENEDESSFLKFILNKDYLERPLIDDIMNHNYFENVSIDRIISKEETPPYTPNDIKINNWNIDSFSIT